MFAITFKCLLPRFSTGACVLGALLLAGCAATQIGAQWADPEFKGQSLKGARLLVACDAPETTLQRICQDAISAQLQALGATPVQAPDPGTNGRQPQVEQMLPAARIAGVTAIFSSSVMPDVMVVSAGPEFNVGLGGFGGSGYGSGMGGGVSVALPSTMAQTSAGYAAHAMLTDVASGRVMWSARATTPAQTNLNAQLDELARAVVGAAQQAGLF